MQQYHVVLRYLIICRSRLVLWVARRVRTRVSSYMQKRHANLHDSSHHRHVFTVDRRQRPASLRRARRLSQWKKLPRHTHSHSNKYENVSCQGAHNKQTNKLKLVLKNLPREWSCRPTSLLLQTFRRPRFCIFFFTHR